MYLHVIHYINRCINEVVNQLNKYTAIKQHIQKCILKSTLQASLHVKGSSENKYLFQKSILGFLKLYSAETTGFPFW